MPTEDAQKAWARRLGFETKSSEMTGRALGNSATYRRTAERQDADGIVGDLVLDVFTSGGPTGASILRKIFVSGPRWLRDTIRSRTDREVADLLVNPSRAKDLPNVLRRAAGQQRTAGNVRAVGPASIAAASANITNDGRGNKI
jgi:hypothetical protein